MGYSSIKPGELFIDDGHDNDELFAFKIEGAIKARGMVPPSRVEFKNYHAPPSDMKTIPKSDWSDMIRNKVKYKTQLSDILLRGDNGRPIPSTDQNGDGYCWGYSTVGCVQTIRARDHEPYIALNPHAICAVIKNGANQGGWCGLSAKFLREQGVPTFRYWPEHSRDYRRYWTRECQEEAARYKVTEEWIDVTIPVYSQNFDSFEQIATCLLLNIPCALDFNWWGHSVLACDLVEDNGAFMIRIRNSWTDGWGDRGFAVLSPSKSIPDGGVGLRVVGTGRSDRFEEQFATRSTTVTRRAA